MKTIVCLNAENESLHAGDYCEVVEVVDISDDFEKEDIVIKIRKVSVKCASGRHVFVKGKCIFCPVKESEEPGLEKVEIKKVYRPDLRGERTVME